MRSLTIPTMKYHDASYSPTEIFEIDDRPNCSNCCDTGTFYNDNDMREHCDCDAGLACESNHDDNDDFDEGGLFEDDSDALASAGWGTDEDYGYDGGDY